MDREYNEIRTFTVNGERIDVRVDNIFNETETTQVYATCPQWHVWNTQRMEAGLSPMIFPTMLGGYSDPEEAFQAAVQATQAGLAMQAGGQAE